MWSPKEDLASAGVVGEVVIIAIAIIGAAAIYSVFSEKRAEDPAALAISGGSGGTGDVRTFHVAAAGSELRWGRVDLLLDGADLVYDGGLAADGTWCRIAAGVCLVPAHAEARVMAGEEFRIRQADAAGRVLVVRDAEANVIMQSRVLGG